MTSQGIMRTGNYDPSSHRGPIVKTIQYGYYPTRVRRCSSSSTFRGYEADKDPSSFSNFCGCLQRFDRSESNGNSTYAFIDQCE